MKCMHMTFRDRVHSGGCGVGVNCWPFGSFPKIHPIWLCDPFLRLLWLLRSDYDRTWILPIPIKNPSWKHTYEVRMSVFEVEKSSNSSSRRNSESMLLSLSFLKIRTILKTIWLRSCLWPSLWHFLCTWEFQLNKLIKLVLAMKHLNIYFCSSRPKKTDLLFLRPWWSITYLVVHLIYFVALAWLRWQRVTRPLEP